MTNKTKQKSPVLFTFTKMFRIKPLANPKYFHIKRYNRQRLLCETILTFIWKYLGLSSINQSDKQTNKQTNKKGLISK